MCVVHGSKSKSSIMHALVFVNTTGWLFPSKTARCNVVFSRAFCQISIYAFPQRTRIYAKTHFSCLSNDGARLRANRILYWSFVLKRFSHADCRSPNKLTNRTHARSHAREVNSPQTRIISNESFNLTLCRQKARRNIHVNNCSTFQSGVFEFTRVKSAFALNYNVVLAR